MIFWSSEVHLQPGHPVSDMFMVTSAPKSSHELQYIAPGVNDSDEAFPQSIDDLLLEVEDLFERQLRIDSLLSMSRKLQNQLHERLNASPQCMLPSYNYTLPTGKEQGMCLALEVGGSTLRVALMELLGKGINQENLRVRRIECSPIDANVRQLRKFAFFDWIAERIGDVLAMERHTKLDEPLRMGIAWSFPIE